MRNPVGGKTATSGGGDMNSVVLVACKIAGWHMSPPNKNTSYTVTQ